MGSTTLDRAYLCDFLFLYEAAARVLFSLGAARLPSFSFFFVAVWYIYRAVNEKVIDPRCHEPAFRLPMCGVYILVAQGFFLQRL